MEENRRSLPGPRPAGLRDADPGETPCHRALCLCAHPRTEDKSIHLLAYVAHSGDASDKDAGGGRQWVQRAGEKPPRPEAGGSHGKEGSLTEGPHEALCAWLCPFRISSPLSPHLLVFLEYLLLSLQSYTFQGLETTRLILTSSLSPVPGKLAGRQRALVDYHWRKSLSSPSPCFKRPTDSASGALRRRSLQARDWR